MSVFDRTITVNIPDPKGKPEPTFAMPVFAEDVAIDGPSGKYRFLATFQRAARRPAATSSSTWPIRPKCRRWKRKSSSGATTPSWPKWLGANGIKTRPFTPAPQPSREVILVGNARPGRCRGVPRVGPAHRPRLPRRVPFPEVFEKGDKIRPVGCRWSTRAVGVDLADWLYHKDDWAKNHPIFDGLPAGCIMDHTFYREIIPTAVWIGQDVPAEVVAGAINTACGYGSGLTVAVYKLGAGRFTLNTLRIRENLGSDPVAERLLRNMLRYAARDANQPPADLPADFDAQLKAMGY